jgi:hypothetical protein
MAFSFASFAFFFASFFLFRFVLAELMLIEEAPMPDGWGPRSARLRAIAYWTSSSLSEPSRWTRALAMAPPRPPPDLPRPPCEGRAKRFGAM